MSMSFIILVASIIFSLQLVNVASSDHDTIFTVTIRANKKECFHLIATEGQRVYGSYEITMGDEKGIQFTVSTYNHILSIFVFYLIAMKKKYIYL